MLDFTKSLRGRLSVYFAVAIVSSLLLSGLFSAVLVQRYLRQKTIDDLQAESQSLAGQIENEGLPLQRYVTDLEKVNGIRAIVIPRNERSLSNSPLAPGGRSGRLAPTNRALNFIDWNQLQQGGTQVIQTGLPGVKSNMVMVIHGVKNGDEVVGAVLLAKPVQSLQSWLPLAGWFLVAAVISLILSLVVAYLLARHLSRPLHEITLAATSVAEGDFSQPLMVHSQDEIGRLADAFRHMTVEVQKSQEQQRQFVINVSHELRTPLTSISGHARALADGVAADPEEVGRSLEVINVETGRLSRLIEDLLSLAKFDAHQFELRSASVKLPQLLDSLAAGFAVQAQEKGVTLATAAPGEAAVATDPDRLRQILSNLVQNALTHTPAGGKIKVSAAVAAGRTTIEVSDTGAGIAAEDLPHVFDRFYRSGGDRDAGLGLGLAISRELARAMGGDIAVSSKPGRGSSFTLTLPS